MDDDIEFVEYSSGSNRSEVGSTGDSDNGTSGGGSGTGNSASGSKRRGRPPGSRNKVEGVTYPQTQYSVNDDKDDTDNDSSPKRRGRKPNQTTGSITKAVVNIGVMSGMSAIGTLVSLTDDNVDRPWFRLTAEEVEPISTPLELYINSLSTNVKNRINQYAMPVALLIGAVQVVGTPIRAELEYRKMKRQYVQSSPRPISATSNGEGNYQSSPIQPSTVNSAPPANNGYRESVKVGRQPNIVDGYDDIHPVDLGDDT